MMWRHTGLGLGGTPRRPNRPTTTWPSNSGGSSSPPDFATHTLARPPRKKPKPSSQPGPQPEHDQPKLRNTRDAVGAENAVTVCDLHILVYQAAESISSQRPECCSGRWGSGACGRLLM